MASRQNVGWPFLVIQIFDCLFGQCGIGGVEICPNAFLGQQFGRSTSLAVPTEELTNLARTLKNRLTGINRSRRLVAFLAFAGFMQSRQKGIQKPIFDRLKATFSSHNSPSEPFFLAT
jgi:hypothetical protein